MDVGRARDRRRDSAGWRSFPRRCRRHRPPSAATLTTARLPRMETRRLDVDHGPARAGLGGRSAERLAHDSRMARRPDKARPWTPRVAGQTFALLDSPRMVTARGRLALGAGCGARWASRVTGRGAGAMIGGLVSMTLDQLDPRPARRRPSHRRRDRHQRQVDDHQDDRCRAGHHGPRRHQRRGRQHGRRPHRGAGGRTEAPSWRRSRSTRCTCRTSWTPSGRAVVVLLNLSRDQLDRVGEINHIERTLRGGLARHPERGGRGQLRRRPHDLGGLRQPARGVGGRGRQLGERLGELPAQRRGHRARRIGHWYSTGTDFKRPTPQWSYDDTHVYGPDGSDAADDAGAAGRRQPRQRRRRPSRLPSPSAPIPRAAVAAVSAVDEVAGRYRTVQLGAAHRRGCCWPRTRRAGRRRCRWSTSTARVGGDRRQRSGARRRGPVVAVGRRLRALRRHGRRGRGRARHRPGGAARLRGRRAHPGARHDGGHRVVPARARRGRRQLHGVPAAEAAWPAMR